MTPRLSTSLCALTSILLGWTHAAAQLTPDYGIPFRTIDAAGNRPTIPSETPWQPELQVGSIGYEFRMSQTEVTTSQYIDFLRAYSPYWNGSPGTVDFTGFWIYYDTSRGYYIPEGYENHAAQASWGLAARFCNWLHNGQAADLASFETGVYDMASGARDRLPGATFWLPTEDEWIKAAYYDVDRYGPGLDGYWIYPDRDNVPLIRGLPGTGAETNAGIGVPMPVGRYPDSASPWGLLDLSGSDAEWLETFVNVSGPEARGYRGSQNVGIPGDALDRLDIFSDYHRASALLGIRLASSVPSPSALVFTLCAIVMLNRRTQ